MINRFTLRFKDQVEEMKYAKEQGLLILQEFRVFFLVAQVFSLYHFVQYLIDGFILVPIIALSGALTTVYSYRLLIVSPQRINLILSFYQLLLAVVFNFKVVLSNQYPPQGHAWFYGFECSFFHLALILQGTNFIWNSLSFCIPIASYVYLAKIKDYPFLSSNYFSVFFGMTILRYTYEKYKRKDYLHRIEQNEWQQTIIDFLPAWIALVRHDEKEDQLKIIRCNQLFDQHKNIKSDCAMLRQFLRQVVIKSDVKVGLQINNLEDLIRRMLLDTENQDLFSNRAKMVGIDIKLQITYDVRVVTATREEEKVAIVVINPQQHQQLLINSRKNSNLYQRTLNDLIQLTKQTSEQEEADITRSSSFQVPRYLSQRSNIMDFKPKINGNLRIQSITLANLQNFQKSQWSFSHGRVMELLKESVQVITNVQSSSIKSLSSFGIIKQNPITQIIYSLICCIHDLSQGNTLNPIQIQYQKYPQKILLRLNFTDIDIHPESLGLFKLKLAIITQNTLLKKFKKSNHHIFRKGVYQALRVIESKQIQLMYPTLFAVNLITALQLIKQLGVKNKITPRFDQNVKFLSIFLSLHDSMIISTMNSVPMRQESL